MKNTAQVGAVILAATGLTAALLTGCVSESAKVERLPVVGTAPTFTRPLTVTADGESVKISFAVDRETDVTVAIRDRQGRVVRHLASGVLGKNPPPPLKAGSLEQELIWDRFDDDGRAVPGGRYEVDVSLALTPVAVRSMGWDAKTLGDVNGLAAGVDGSLTVLSQADYGFVRIQRFNRDGEYEKTLVPRSGALPMDRVQTLGEMTLADGQRIPEELLPQFGSGTRQTPLMMPGGDLVLVNGPGRGHPEGHRYRSHERGQNPPRRLLRLAPDGGASTAGYLGPELGKGFENGDLYLALGPDNQTIYISGARHAVFRVVWGQTGEPQRVVGRPDTAGNGPNLKDPRGVAVGASGNIYVADRGNHRVVGFSPEGRLIGQVDVEWPDQLFIDQKTGALYVTAGYGKGRLLKLRGLRKEKPAIELDLPMSQPLAALDASGKEPIFYLANVQQPGKDKALIRVRESGGAFKVERETASGAAPAIPFLLGADREDERVYDFAQGVCSAGYGVFDGRDGSFDRMEIPLHPKANQISEATVAANGNVVFHVRREMGRLDPKQRPQPFSGNGSFVSVLPEEDSPRSNYDRGCCVAPNGDIYWIFERGGYSQPMRCSVLGADGVLKKDSLIVFESGSPAGIRVDRKGCVYTIDHLKPIGRLLPEALENGSRTNRHDRFVYNYGSLLKFRPEGGVVKKVSDKAPGKAAQGAFTTAEGRGRFEVDGLEWSYFGVSMVQPALARSEKSPYCCQCYAPRFDLDGFDRVYVPDQLRCAVQVLDSNGNPILRFGGYGNVDDSGIALADPRTVMVTDEAAYIGDVANGRVVRVELAGRTRGGASIDIAMDKGGVPWILSQVKMETGKMSPALAKKLDWAALDGTTVEEIRESVCLAARDVADWPEKEAAAFLRENLNNPSEKVRAAAAWSLWSLPAGRDASLELLKGALKDASPLVRVVAAYVLINANDAAGVAEILAAARSENPDVYKLAETAILRRVVRWDSADPLASQIDRKAPLVPQFPIGEKETEALVQLLDAREWYLNRAVLLMLGQSGQPAAAQAILGKLKAGGFKDKNLNRALGSLGVLRCKAAVPEMLKYLERGRAANHGTLEYNGDEAEKYAASALARVGDPETVSDIVAMLASGKPNTPGEALRCLSLMFNPALPGDRRLVPTRGKLEEVRVNELPDVRIIHQSWDGFWKQEKDKYRTHDGGIGLEKK